MEVNAVPAMHAGVKELVKNNPSYLYHKIRDEEEIALPFFPLNPSSDWRRCIFPENFTLVLPKGKAFGPHGVVMTSNNIMVEEVCYEWSRSIDKHTIFERTSMPPLQNIHGTVGVVAGQAASNYYHWMMEILPRIKLLKSSGIRCDKLYVPRLRFRFQKNTLAKFGFFKDDLIVADDNTFIQADNLIVPSLVNRACTTHPMWVIEFLRDVFLPLEFRNVPRTKRLFIVREAITTTWARRFVINADEVWRYLQARGFEQVVLERLDIEEQAKLFCSAEMIIGTHGAGLTNLAFCQAGAKVIEIFHPSLRDATYWFLSDQMKLDHYCVATSLEGLTADQKARGDVFIPIQMLVDVFARFSSYA